MTTQPPHKCLMEGCTERVPASSEHGFCEKHEIIAVQLYHDLSEDVPTYKTPIPICSDCGSPLDDDETCPTCDDRDLADPPEMYHCKYCGSWHPIAAKEFYCPLDRASHA